MQSKTWIYDYDKLTFEPYAEKRSLESMKGHTGHGELIIHLDQQGLLWFVENEEATLWQADEIAKVDGLTWYRDTFVQPF